jgi:hypothetical protein
LVEGGLGGLSAQLALENTVNREETRKSTPLSGHVYDCKTIVDVERVRSFRRTGEFDSVIKNLIVVKETS